MFESIHFNSKGRATTSASNPEVLAKLREIVGDENVIVDPEKVEPYGVHERLLHFVDVEYFNKDANRREYAHDLSAKPTLADGLAIAEIGKLCFEIAREVVDDLVMVDEAQIAMAVADNAGRVRTTIDEADIDEIMIGARKMGSAIGLTTSGRIILSDLEQRTTTTGANGNGPVTTANPNGYRQWVRWQRCSGALNVTSSLGVPRNASGVAVTDISSTRSTWSRVWSSQLRGVAGFRTMPGRQPASRIN